MSDWTSKALSESAQVQRTLVEMQGALHLKPSNGVTANRRWNMKHRLFSISVLVVIVLSTRSLAPVATGQLQGTALVQISWRSQTDLATVEASGIPVYARLAADRGTYLLAGATPQQAEASALMELSERYSFFSFLKIILSQCCV